MVLQSTGARLKLNDSVTKIKNQDAVLYSSLETAELEEILSILRGS